MSNNNDIYTSLKNAQRNKSREFFYDFGPESAYEQVQSIYNNLKSLGYNVKFEKSGLRIKLNELILDSTHLD